MDDYCQLFADLFPEVRGFEAFKYLHMGMVSEIKRKSLPAIARAVGLENHQNLHHFLNHGLWLLADQEVVSELWQTFTRTFSNGTTEIRYQQEVVYGRRRQKQYWLLTTDPETLPQNSTSFVIVKAPAIKLNEIGDNYGFRTWLEYGLKQANNALTGLIFE